MSDTHEEIIKGAADLRNRRLRQKLKPSEIDWQAYLMEGPANLKREGLGRGRELHQRAVTRAVKRRKKITAACNQG